MRTIVDVYRKAGIRLANSCRRRTALGLVGAAKPLPTPIREVLMDIRIEYDGVGYLLCYESRDGSVYGDTWHESRAEAEEVASDLFGVQSEQW